MVFQVGLCVNIRNVPWFDSMDPGSFFPRCYRLSHEEEKQAFIGRSWSHVNHSQLKCLLLICNQIFRKNVRKYKNNDVN